MVLALRYRDRNDVELLFVLGVMISNGLAFIMVDRF